MVKLYDNERQISRLGSLIKTSYEKSMSEDELSRALGVVDLSRFEDGKDSVEQFARDRAK